MVPDRRFEGDQPRDRPCGLSHGGHEGGFRHGQGFTRGAAGRAGQWRGGASQVIEIANREAAPFAISAATFDRIIHPAQGREGGEPGCRGSAGRGSGSKLPDKGVYIIETGDSLVLELPGGGGFGNPDKRDRAALEADMAAGLVTIEAARRDYGYDG